MYSFIILEKIIKELNIQLLDNYDEQIHYTGKMQFRIKCSKTDCEEERFINFSTLLQNYEAKTKLYCKKHRYSNISNKISKTKNKNNKEKYENNKKKLNPLEKMNSIQVEDNLEREILREKALNDKNILSDIILANKQVC